MDSRGNHGADRDMVHSGVPMMRFLLRFALLASIYVGTSANYALPIVLPSQVYVSSVNCGGIPVGDDLNGNGSMSSPFATPRRGAGAVAPGGAVLLNGCNGSPGFYTYTGTVNASQTWTAINTGYAVVSGTDATRALLVGANGITFTLNGVVVDPSLNTGGAAPRGIELVQLSGSNIFTLALNNVTVQNFSLYGIYAPSGPANLNIVANNLTLTMTSGTSNSGFYLPNMSILSSVSVTGGSCNQSAVITSAFGCVFINVPNAGARPSCTFSNFSTNVTTDPSLNSVSNINYGIRLQDCLGTITGGTHFGSTGGVHAFENLAIQQTSFGISGSSINHVQMQNTGQHGLFCILGVDSPGDKTLAVGVTINDCSNDQMGASSTVEGIVMGSVTNGLIENTKLIGGNVLSTGYGCKDSLDCTYQNNYVQDVTCCYEIHKGNTGTVSKGNTAKSVLSGATGALLQITVNSDTGLPDTGAQIGPNLYWNAGGTGVTFLNQQATTTPTFLGNTYTLTPPGTNAANVFQAGGVNYTTCPSFTAALDVTGVCNGF